jgi:hypothetical protein
MKVQNTLEHKCSGVIAFFSVVALINRQQYALPVPGMLLLAFLAPTALAHG